LVATTAMALVVNCMSRIGLVVGRVTTNMRRSQLPWICTEESHFGLIIQVVLEKTNAVLRIEVQPHECNFLHCQVRNTPCSMSRQTLAIV
jgi:hypothetical protein